MIEEYDPLASVQAAGPPGSISFNYGLPDSRTFPTDKLRWCFEQVFENHSDLALQYGAEQGYGPMIDFLLQKIGRSEDMNFKRPQIMLTGGSTGALDHICTLFTKSGDPVFVEAPCYRDSLQLLRDHGLRVFQIPMDDNGMIVEELEARLDSLKRSGESPRFIYTIPTFQNPSGITLSEERRRNLVEIGKQRNILIVEDDVYCDLAYENIKHPALFSLANGQNVFRLGSFSKIMSPGLRLGWVLGTEENIKTLCQSGLRLMGGGVNPLIAIAMSEFCRKGWLEPHIERIKEIYRKRKNVMIKALETFMPDGVHWTNPKGGFFVWITLPEFLRSVDVVNWAGKEKILFLAGDSFFAESPTGQHLRLAYSYLDEEKIQEGIKKLADVLKDHL